MTGVWSDARARTVLRRIFDVAVASADPKSAVARNLPPKPKGRCIVVGAVEAACGLGPNAKPNELEKRISKSVKSNGSERRVLIQILGYCGILKPAGRCGFLQAFTSSEHRDRPPDHTNDWSYPVIWWRGADGSTEAPSTSFSRKLRP